MNDHGKTAFQVERIAFFSDAVFAIAITLLIIEIKVPEGLGKPVGHELWLLVPRFIGFIVSFLVIAVYWVNHHLLFKYITGYNQQLLWTNIFLLLSIVLMPFSSGFYSQFWQSRSEIPLVFYVANICFTGFLNTRIWYLIGNKDAHLSEGLDDVNWIRYNKARSLIAPVVFLLSIAVASIDLVMAYWFPILIPVFLTILKKYFKAKHPEIFRHR